MIKSKRYGRTQCKIDREGTPSNQCVELASLIQSMMHDPQIPRETMCEILRAFIKRYEEEQHDENIPSCGRDDSPEASQDGGGDPERDRDGPG